MLPYFLPYSFLYLTRYETNGFVAVTEKNNLRYEKVGQELRRKKVIYEIKSRNKFAKHIDLLDLIYANENETKYNNQNDEKKSHKQNVPPMGCSNMMSLKLSS